MLEILQFASASWWNLFCTCGVIISTSAPLSAARGIIVRNIRLGAGG